MGIFRSVAVFALRQFVGDAAEPVVEALTDLYSDRSQRLIQALKTAHDRAWRALEIAVAGKIEFLGQKLRATGDEKAFAQEVRKFLLAFPLPELAESNTWFRECLQELQEARSAGLLTGDHIIPGELARQTADLSRFGSAHEILEVEWQVVSRLAEALKQENKAHIAWLIVQRAPQGPALLLLALRYFFRREVETDAELFRCLTFHQLDDLNAVQTAGFQAILTTFQEHGQQLEEILASVREGFQRIEDSFNQKIDQLRKDVLAALTQRSGVMVHDPVEMQLVEELLKRFRDLPEEQRHRWPDVLNAIGKLEILAGEPQEAQITLRKVCKLTSDPKTLADAYYNLFLVGLLEQGNWPAAFENYQQAVQFDPVGLALVPAEQYVPLAIRSASASEVEFVCQESSSKASVIVSALFTQELNQDVAGVFKEIGKLAAIAHSGICKPLRWGYVDPARQARPYLVFEHFDGISLQDHVEKWGCLKPTDLLSIASQAADALQAAHQLQVLHRELKPSNILLRKEPAGWRVGIVGFGLKLKQDLVETVSRSPAIQRRTRLASMLARIVDFAAPEYLASNSQTSIGPQADIYSFGKVCWLALFGTANPDYQERVQLSPGWREFLEQCTARNLAYRFSNFAAVLASLHRLAAEPPQDGRVLACPMCKRQLQIPKASADQVMRCPACSSLFEPPALEHFPEGSDSLVLKPAQGLSDVCPRCHRRNPPSAMYCYRDGVPLQEQKGPVAVGTQAFAHPFVFPTGRSCRNFDELAIACQQEWNSARELLGQGHLETFFGGLGRADLVMATREASNFPDRDRGLDQLLAKLPSDVLASPQLGVETREIHLNVVKVGQDKVFELTLSNKGNRLVIGKANVDDDCDWMVLGESGTPEKIVQFFDSLTLPVRIRGDRIRAYHKPHKAHIHIESNGGTASVLVTLTVPVKAFPEGVLAGAQSPRQVAEKVLAKPKEAAVLLENGAVRKWYEENGWPYPVQGPTASGLAAVQQFFEVLGLVKTPKVELTQPDVTLRGKPGERLESAVVVMTREKRAAVAHGVSDRPWLTVGKTVFKGQSATIPLTVQEVPAEPGKTLSARLTVHSNGNQRFEVPVSLAVASNAFDFNEPLEEGEPPNNPAPAPAGNNMPTVVACPSCTTKIAMPVNAAGRQFRCRKCGQVFTAPGPARSAPANPTVRPATFTNSLGMKFVRVPAGTFWMGGGGGQPGGKQVGIANDFYLGVFPVTQQQWQALMGNNPSWFSRTGGGKDQVTGIADADLKQFPVEQVSWEETQEFIRRLNAREKNSEWVYRLPTEAEWEYACRGGASSREECSFHFYLDRPSNDLSSDLANFDGNYPFGSGRKGIYLQRTTKVGSYKPNRLGIYDMHGNVWEWCQDIFQGSRRVSRGGSRSSSAEYCQAASCFGREPALRNNDLGFRLARVTRSGSWDTPCPGPSSRNHKGVKGVLVSPRRPRDGEKEAAVQPQPPHHFTRIRNEVSGESAGDWTGRAAAGPYPRRCRWR